MQRSPHIRDANCRFYGMREGSLREIEAAECLRSMTREWNGVVHVVTIGEDRIIRWNDRTWGSLSEVDGERLRLLEREVKELRRVNEILRKASAYFAMAELNRPGR